MRIDVELIDKPEGSRGPVAEAVVTLRGDGELLDGLRIEGFTVWKSTKSPGDFYAQGPSQQFEKREGGKGYRNFIAGDAAKRLCGIVAAEYRKENGIGRQPGGGRRIDEGRPAVDPSDDDLAPF